MRHFGEARALAAEQIAHVGAAGRLAAAEGIDPFALAAALPLLTPCGLAPCGLDAAARLLDARRFGAAPGFDFFTGWREFFERDLAMDASGSFTERRASLMQNPASNATPTRICRAPGLALLNAS